MYFALTKLLPESETFFTTNPLPKKSSAKNKKAHSLRVGRILLIRIAITETPPATPVGGL